MRTVSHSGACVRAHAQIVARARAHTPHTWWCRDCFRFPPHIYHSERVRDVCKSFGIFAAKYALASCERMNANYHLHLLLVLRYNTLQPLSWGQQRLPMTCLTANYCFFDCACIVRLAMNISSTVFRGLITTSYNILLHGTCA
jgi:hypothetical protein